MQIASLPSNRDRENGQEAFLILAGECTLIVEGKERRLVSWDFFYCVSPHPSFLPTQSSGRDTRRVVV